MKSLFWLTIGVVAGFVVAHRMNETGAGRAFFSDIDTKAKDFTSALTVGYRTREAELRDAISSAEDTIADLSQH